MDIGCSSSDVAFIFSILKNIMKLIQIIGPILAIIALALHFIQLMKDPDNKKLLPKIKNTIIALLLLFFIPVFVDALFGILGSKTSFSACWNSAGGISYSHTYIDPYGDDKTTFYQDPKDYENGKPKSLPSQVDDGKYSQYETIATCNSETMKFKIIRVSGQDLAIIWVQDPLKQFNGGLAAANSKARLPAETILNNEINANGLQSKCLVAVNASFFSYSTNSPVSGVVINHGKIAKNEGNAGGCIGVNKEGKLIECSHQSAEAILKQGIRNTFGISSRAGLDNTGAKANRTQICQIDTNNFVLLSGSGTVGGTALITKNVTGCAESFNLDGGGSRKLFYKTQTSGLTKVFGGDRTVPDMLYFSEA